MTNTSAIPCVLALDLNLPRYDGLAVLKAIRREPALEHVRVIALTGGASPRVEAEVRSLGVRLYLAKPTDLNGFVKLAEDIIAICKEPVLQTVDDSR